MRKSPALSAKMETALADFQPQPPDLIFPVNPDFVSKPPRLPWAHAYQLCEQALNWTAMGSEFEKKRLLRKIDVEFVL